MRPENIPYYCGPCLQPPTLETKSANTLHIQGLLTDLIVFDGKGHTHLSNVPVQFGKLYSALPKSGLLARALMSSEFTQYARETMNYDWEVYSFSKWALCLYR